MDDAFLRGVNFVVGNRVFLILFGAWNYLLANAGLKKKAETMILEKFEIGEGTVDEIVIAALKRTMQCHDPVSEPDSPEIVAACKKLIEYYGTPW